MLVFQYLLLLPVLQVLLFWLIVMFFFCFIKLRAEMWQNVRYITLDILDSVSIIACVSSDDTIGLFMSIHFQDDEEYMREDNVACVAIVLLFPVLLVKL